MLLAWNGVGMPFWFAGGFNPAGTLPSLLLMPSKQFADGLDYNQYWLIYMTAPFIAGGLSAALFHVHLAVWDKVKDINPKTES
jgi:hypothetical protein